MNRSIGAYSSAEGRQPKFPRPGQTRGPCPKKVPMHCVKCGTSVGGDKGIGHQAFGHHREAQLVKPRGHAYAIAEIACTSPVAGQSAIDVGIVDSLKAQGLADDPSWRHGQGREFEVVVRGCDEFRYR